jgi:hypothetical protein
MRNHLAALGEDESCQLLASSTRGPLVTCVAGGTRLLSAVTNERVAFDVDDRNVEKRLECHR